MMYFARVVGTRFDAAETYFYVDYLKELPRLTNCFIGRHLEIYYIPTLSSTVGKIWVR